MKITLDTESRRVYTFGMSTIERICRYCGQPCAPNRGPGHIDVCPECVEEDVPLVRAGMSQDESGTVWDIGTGPARVLRGGKVLCKMTDEDRVVRSAWNLHWWKVGR